MICFNSKCLFNEWKSLSVYCRQCFSTFSEICSSSSSRIQEGDGEETSVASLESSGENACDDCTITLPRKMRCSPVFPNTVSKSLYDVRCKYPVID